MSRNNPPADLSRESRSLHRLLGQIRRSRIGADKLPHEPRPILQVGINARILIASQAPGRKAHEAGIPFADPSGDRLREWLGITPEQFYDPERVAIVPMGFCYPGSGKGGDLPPRPEDAELWREKLLRRMPRIELTLVIGKYAMAWHLPELDVSVTEVVSRWRELWPEVVPLPHPSPRNKPWVHHNPWFEAELLPELRLRVQQVLQHGTSSSS